MKLFDKQSRHTDYERGDADGKHTNAERVEMKRLESIYLFTGFLQSSRSLLGLK